MRRDGDDYIALDIDKTETRGYVVAENNHIGVHQCPCFLGCGVVEFDSVRTVVVFDVEDKGLI